MERKVLRRNISYMERELSQMKRELALLEERELINSKQLLEPIFTPDFGHTAMVSSSELSTVEN
ncbi:hypothetical protein [Photobacterium sanguinicancri]|uniref:hypothetical protein n=1 Tax=Photobacterium sanguinicancri TaxID=875932 RepID=UPI00114027B8|nr:hypothetical protein [Photobacterium sanguinicancri]